MVTGSNKTDQWCHDFIHTWSAGGGDEVGDMYHGEGDYIVLYFNCQRLALLPSR